jgi:tRNA(Ile)-lysidine synthase
MMKPQMNAKSLPRRFVGYVRKHALWAPEKPILLAVSGGADSVAMAHLVARMGQQAAIAHVNYGLRGAESDRDEAFVEALAAELKMTFHVLTADKGILHTTGTSIQAQARMMRYRWFQQLVDEYGYHRVATAHHKDDQAETILYRLLRSRSHRVLEGMRPQQGLRVRPLLFAYSAEIREWLQSEGLPWVEDSSNAKVSYARNYLRHKILPRFEKLHPNYAQALQDRLDDYESQLALISKVMEHAIAHAIRPEAGGFWLDEAIATDATYGELPQFLAYMLRERLHWQLPEIEQCIQLLGHPGGVKADINGWRVTRHPTGLQFENPLLEQPKLRLEEPEGEFQFAGWNIELKRVPRPEQLVPAEPNAFFLSLEAFKSPIELRVPRLSEQFQPLGLKGHKTMRELLNQLRPSMPKGTQMLGLYAQNHCLLLLPFRISDAAKVVPDAQEVMQVRIWPVQF